MREPRGGVGRARSACVVAACVAALIPACAARTVPEPVDPAYPAFVYPAVPPGLQDPRAVPRIERGWRYLQGNALDRAEAEFAAALGRNPQFYPAITGQGYASLARGRYDQAVEAFDRALSQSGEYVPALVGRGHALLALDREEEAAGAFEAAVRADASLDALRTRAQVLRLRVLEQKIERARAAAQAGQVAEAARAYDEVLADSPDSAFLHREAAAVARRAGDVERALTHLRRATALDERDAASHVQIGELLEARGEFEAAADAYRAAAAIEPSADLSARITAVSERAREARLPAEYRAIAEAETVSRAQLAALLGVRLEGLLQRVPGRPVIITDVRGHWASAWIDTVVGAGLFELFENYTFQPERGVTRADLAEAARRVAMLVSPQTPALTRATDDQPTIPDVGPRHLSYPAVSFVIRSGVLPLGSDGRFAPGRAVTGREALEAIARLRALADDRR